ncbi:Uncharacterised protein [Mycobacterium tuberculosis]|nr:Uncharacterised protein [Mycobacterium tuberculosis]
MTVKPFALAHSCTIGIEGSRPPGKISVTMNFRKRAKVNDMGRPRSWISFGCNPVMVCSSMTPSAGSRRCARLKNAS